MATSLPPRRPAARAPQAGAGATVESLPPPALAFDAPTFEGEARPSIIPPEFENIILITGFRGMGKTYLGLGTDHPSNILMMDFESKGKGVAKPYGVGAYFGIMDEVVGKYGKDFDLQVVYDRVTQILEAVPQDRFTTLFMDNAEYLQDGSIQLVNNNPAKATKYGLKPENVMSGGFGGARPAAKHILNAIFKLARSKGIRLIVVSFQLKGAWKDSKPLFNKFKMTDVTIWHEMSILTLVLVDPMPETLASEGMPIPRALVMKEQLGEMVWDEELNRPKIRRRLPYAIPKAEMWRIYKYLTDPADFKNPKPGETVDPLEIAPFTPTFGKEQLSIMEKVSRMAQLMEGPSGSEESSD